MVLRCEIEEELIEGKLDVEDLPKKWNMKMQQYLGISPKSFAEGCMQDIHWFRGYFGYFPSYCIGTILSSMMINKIRQEDVLAFEKVKQVI